MIQRLRALPLLLLGAFSLLAAWRIVSLMQLEEANALSLSQAATDNTPEQAQTTARRLLAVEPLQGKAFVVLAKASAMLGDQAQALALYKIAAQRAPRDTATRFWLAQYYLQHGQYAQALDHIDSLLRFAPAQAGNINPALVHLAENPQFATALAHVLSANPPWRARTLRAFRAASKNSPLAADQIFQELQNQGGLSQQEYAEWLDSLVAQNRWGEAYARWAGTAMKENGRLAALYNGQFESDISGVGFDWRQRRVPGVLLTFGPAQGVRGQAANFQFLGRRIPTGGLEHPLFLMPGRYQLSLHMRAQTLRSEMGLQWVITCAGRAGVIARSEPIGGTFAWQQVQFDFSVPSANCPGAWLKLLNPVPGGAGQVVSGSLSVADVALKAIE